MEDGPSQSFLDKVRSLFRRLRGEGSAGRLEEELHILIDQGAERGVISPGEGEMIQSIFEFKETVAREIMVPRTSIVAVSINATLGQAIELILTNGHTRIPVFAGDIDHIEGLLMAKDLLSYWGRPAEESLPKEIVRPPIFVPESKKIVDLLAELRTKKSHLAIVLDEYGGTAGLVTLEDIIEEIVGEIHDEYDVEEELVTFIDENTILVDARLNIEDLADLTGVELPEGDYETVGGFITDLTGRVPQADEQVSFGGLTLTIRSADERKINQVEIKRPNPAGDLGAGNA
ncbi:MAG: hemolysin family protein [Thermodesulfobacteriota bacterium]